MSITRRDLLLRSGALAGAGLLLPGARRLLVPQNALAAEGALTPYSMAMHLHSSFSEGDASMETHLSEAAKNHVNVLWWTDHDWRMMGYGYRQVVHFDAMSEIESGRTWTWVPRKTGTLASSSGAIVASPYSPLDPHPPGALRVAATSGGTAAGGYYLEANTAKARKNERSTLAGQVLEIEIFPEQIGPSAYLEILIISSAHPAQSGRPAGTYSLSYRFGGAGAPGSRVAQGLTGVVTLGVQPGQMNSVRLTPAEDIAAIWPGMDSRDFSIRTLRLGAASRSGAPCSGVFDFLRFSRISGDAARAVQARVMANYAPRFPGVKQYQGLEVSHYDPHVNWYGGTQAMPNYGPYPGKANGRDFARQAIASIHSSGGVASYNHMYGTAGTLKSESVQESMRAKVAAQLVTDKALGADLLEVGYRQRAGVTLERHVAVWDVCSRNGIFLTGTGVSDAHGQQPWTGLVNRFLTWAWAPSGVETDLLAALRAGRVYTGDMSLFAGSLDLVVDGCCPMGGVSVSTLATRSLRVTATGIPAGGSLRLVRGLVDYAGPGTPAPNTVVAATWPATAFTTGSSTVSVDNSRSSFLRTEVLDGTGKIVALSNPVWLFTSAPATPVPAARARTCP